MENSSKKVIAFLDILGFSDLVNNNGHERLAEIYQKLFSPIITEGLAKNHTILYSDIADRKAKRVIDYSKIKINSLIVSDSVILWTNDDTHYSYIEMFLTVKVIMSSSFVMGFPLRGAIVDGNLSNFNGMLNQATQTTNTLNTLVGLGLVNAYKMEENQSWSGCIIDDDCAKNFDKLCDPFRTIHNGTTLAGMVDHCFLQKYDVPLKYGTSLNSYVIDWVNMPNSRITYTESDVKKKFSYYNKNIDSPRVQTIMQNTLKFIDFAQQKRPYIPKL